MSAVVRRAAEPPELTVRTPGWQAAVVRTPAGCALLVVGTMLLGGPVFGLAVLMAGEAVHVRGGWIRLVLDLVIGGLCLSSSLRMLRSRPLHR